MRPGFTLHAQLLLVWALLSQSGAALGQTKPPCHWSGKKRIEQYWGFKVQVDCKGANIERFRVYTLQEQLLWDMPVKNNLIHGSALLRSCEAGKCRQVASINYSGGALEGKAVIENVEGSTATVQFRDGVLHGPFSLSTPYGLFNGRFDDGRLDDMSGPPGGTNVRNTLARLVTLSTREHFDLYRELFDYDLWKKSEEHRTYDNRGTKVRDVVGGFQRTYSAGLRTQDEPFSGTGIRTAYENGVPKTFTKIKKRQPVAVATAEDPNNWKEPPEAYYAGFRPNKLVAVLGAGYGSAGTTSFDLTLMAASFRDGAGGGYGLMYGLHRFDEPYHSVNAVVGGAAMYLTFYAAAGVRTDMDLVEPELSLGVGIVLPMVYIRLAPPGQLGHPLEAGLTLKLPLGI